MCICVCTPSRAWICANMLITIQIGDERLKEGASIRVTVYRHTHIIIRTYIITGIVTMILLITIVPSGNSVGRTT